MGDLKYMNKKSNNIYSLFKSTNISLLLKSREIFVLLNKLCELLLSIHTYIHIFRGGFKRVTPLRRSLPISCNNLLFAITLKNYKLCYLKEVELIINNAPLLSKHV